MHKYPHSHPSPYSNMQLGYRQYLLKTELLWLRSPLCFNLSWPVLLTTFVLWQPLRNCTLHIAVTYGKVGLFYKLQFGRITQGTVSSVMYDSVRPHELQHAGFPSITNSGNLLKFMSIQLVMPSNHLILCRPLLPPSVFPSIRVFSCVSSSQQVLRVLELQHQLHSFQ